MVMKKKRGQSMIEIIIAIGIMTVGITFSVSLLMIVEKGVTQTSLEMQAIFYAEEGIQAVISVSDRSGTAVAVGTYGLAVQASPAEWIFSGASDTQNGMTRVVTVSAYDADTKKIDVLVTWHPAPNRTATVDEQILLTDWAFL
jgi:type II secretory pathway pseudopilin PulG